MVVEQKYTKPSLTIDEQIKLLEARGLHFNDLSSAKKCLRSTGYFRLSNIFRHFQDSNNDFNPNISFEDIWHIYCFDRKLRILILEAVEIIEVALKNSICDYMSIKYGPYWYCDAMLFSSFNWHKSFISKIKHICHIKEDLTLKEFYLNYPDADFPPSWIIIQSFSLGNCCHILKWLKRQGDKQVIVKPYQTTVLGFQLELEKIRKLRNICAHHGTLWDKFEIDKINMNKSEYILMSRFEFMAKTLCAIEGHDSWYLQLQDIISEFAYYFDKQEEI